MVKVVVPSVRNSEIQVFSRDLLSLSPSLSFSLSLSLLILHVYVYARANTRLIKLPAII